MVLGYHSSPFKVCLSYSRDAASRPLAVMEEVLSLIRTGLFRPDETRSGRFAAGASLGQLGKLHSASVDARASTIAETMLLVRPVRLRQNMWRNLGGRMTHRHFPTARALLLPLTQGQTILRNLFKPGVCSSHQKHRQERSLRSTLSTRLFTSCRTQALLGSCVAGPEVRTMGIQWP